MSHGVVRVDEDAYVLRQGPLFSHGRDNTPNYPKILSIAISSQRGYRKFTIDIAIQCLSQGILSCTRCIPTTAAILHHPQPVTLHSAPSPPSTTEPSSFLDAAIIPLRGRLRPPTASQIDVATQRFRHSQRPNNSAYRLTCRRVQPML